MDMIFIDLDSEMQELFYKYRIPNKENKDDLIRKINDEIKIWNSDHFAVYAELKLLYSWI